MPICLTNVTFKISQTLQLLCFTLMAGHIVQQIFMVFIKGKEYPRRNGVLHGSIHKLHRKKLCAVIYKIYFEKSVDFLARATCSLFFF
jgi:hypothetical protein